MNDSDYLDSSGYHDPFGSKTQDLRILLSRAKNLAQEYRQPLNTTHVLVAALDPSAGSLPTPLGTVIPDHVRLGWYHLAWNHITNGRISPSVESCLPFARSIAGDRDLSAALVICAIVESDPDARVWLTSVYGVQGSINDLRAQLRSAAEDSLGPLRTVIQMEPSQLRIETKRLLDAEKLRPSSLHTFARAHAHVLRSIATEMSLRNVRPPRIPLVQGPKGSGVERFVQALVEAPKAKLPLEWRFEDAYCLNMARLFGRDNAHAILEMALEIIGPKSLLILTESRAFDTFAEDAHQAKECLDFLRREMPANVIVVYRTDDTRSLPEGTRFRREIFQDFMIEPLDESSARKFVKDYFIPYWDEVDKVTVAEDAFEDVYAISAYIVEDHVHFNLPYLPIIMGTNAAQTVKRGKDAVLALVEEAQTRLNTARNATKAHKAMDKAFARYFDTLQLELTALKTNSDVRTSKGLPRVTRELVAAELAASPVYLFQWPNIPASGVLAPIVPTDYEIH